LVATAIAVPLAFRAGTTSGDLATGRSASRPDHTTARVVYSAGSRIEFDSPARLTASSPLIVVGTLQGDRTEDVRISAPSGAVPQPRTDLVRTFAVKEVLKGIYAAASIEVRWTIEGSVALESGRTSSVSWPAVDQTIGSTYLLFLFPAKEPQLGESYGVVGEPGVAVVGLDGATTFQVTRQFRADHEGRPNDPLADFATSFDRTLAYHRDLVAIGR
jgi:hypothetical protein